MLKTNSKFKTLINFFIPFNGIKIFKSVHLMLMVSTLLALRIIFQLLTINIPNIGLSISISWVPVMIFSWFFGPIYGCMFGLVSDNLAFVIFGGGIWFWMYAIQEMILGFIVGIFSSISKIRKKSNNILWDFFILQTLFIIFIVFSFVIIIFYLKNDIKQELSNLYTWLSVGLLIVFFIVMQFFIFHFIVNSKQRNENRIEFIYVSLAVIVISILFSFVLGPITFIEYYKVLHNGQLPNDFLQFGYVFLLIPRLIEESIKIPLEITIIATSIRAIKPFIISAINRYNEN